MTSLGLFLRGSPLHCSPKLSYAGFCSSTTAWPAACCLLKLLKQVGPGYWPPELAAQKLCWRLARLDSLAPIHITAQGSGSAVLCLCRMEQPALQSAPEFERQELFQQEGEGSDLPSKKQPAKKKRRHQVAKVKGNWSEEEDTRLVG